jgi:hypothetical protein
MKMADHDPSLIARDAPDDCGPSGILRPSQPFLSSMPTFLLTN